MCSSDRKSSFKCQLCEVLPLTWVPGNINLSDILLKFPPLWSPLPYITHLKKVKSGMSHDESSQLDTQVWILWSSQCATMCAWVSHFDPAFQVEMGTVSAYATGDKMWLFVSQCCHTPRPCDDTAWGKPGRIFYGLRLLSTNFHATSQYEYSSVQY